jgi:hypothetical protein
MRWKNLFAVLLITLTALVFSAPTMAQQDPSCIALDTYPDQSFYHVYLNGGTYFVQLEGDLYAQFAELIPNQRCTGVTQSQLLDELNEMTNYMQITASLGSVNLNTGGAVQSCTYNQPTNAGVCTPSFPAFSQNSGLTSISGKTLSVTWQPHLYIGECDVPGYGCNPPSMPNTGQTETFSQSFSPVPQYAAFDFFRRGSVNLNWTNVYGAFKFVSTLPDDQLTVATAGPDGYDAMMYYNAIPSVTNGCVGGWLDNVGGAQTMRFNLRINPSTNSAYEAYAWNGNLYIDKIVNGQYFWVASASYTPVSSDQVTFCATGTSLTVSTNSTQRISATDSSLASGYFGLAGNTRYTPPSTIRGWFAEVF